jgi:perosamine synthetase
MARPDIGAAEEAHVLEVLRSGSLALGPAARKFEEHIADITGRQYGVAVSSGTAGLHLAVRGLRIGEGDEVITTPFSFIASANCILYERAVPVFVDIEDETLGIDPSLVERAWSPRTSAILPVHVFGHPCLIGDLVRIAGSRGVPLIEDACEALGSTVSGRPLGSFGNASVFAFYPNKQITTGEGGVLVTDDPELADAFRSMRNQGRDEDGTWLRHVRLGFNYRLDEMSAAVGNAQLSRLAELRAGRKRVADLYDSALESLEWAKTPRSSPDSEVNWFLYVVRLDDRIDRDQVIRDMADHGVPSRPYFSPIHLQPFFRETFGYRPGAYPVAERVARSTLALPFSSRHDDLEVERVVETLRSSVDAQLRRGS